LLEALCAQLNLPPFEWQQPGIKAIIIIGRRAKIIAVRKLSPFEWLQPGTGAWLGEAEERLLLETKALHTNMSENQIFRIKNYFEYMKLFKKQTIS